MTVPVYLRAGVANKTKHDKVDRKENISCFVLSPDARFLNCPRPAQETRKDGFRRCGVDPLWKYEKVGL